MKIAGLVVSVDRMERGTGEKSAIQQISEEYGIPTFPIVTVRDIMAFLHNREIDGKVYIDDAMLGKMEGYLREYGV